MAPRSTKTDSKTLNYSHGCRSQTATIPQDHVALHSAQIARYIKKNLEKSHAEIFITNLESNGYSVETKNYPSKGVYIVQKEGWEFRISNVALNK